MPNRSFPVLDCKHVATAKAYLGRSKFSKSAKDKIAACINKKAKKLGCNVTKKAKASYQSLNAAEKKLYSSEDFAITRKLVEASIKDPDKDVEHYVNFL